MASPELQSKELAECLRAHERTKLLRFITCGSVDDGKSTLIGRLLYESGLLFEDQLRTLEVDSRDVGTQGEDLDFALLMDGLQAEREQKITIDVAYRYFQTERRAFILADTLLARHRRGRSVSAVRQDDGIGHRGPATPFSAPQGGT